jgi:Peptidase family M23
MKPRGSLTAFVLSLVAATASAAAAPAGDPSTAIVAMPFHDAFAVPADDARIHVEYDLLVTNVFDAPIAIKSIDVTDAGGRVLMRVDSKTLAAATQTLFEQKSVSSIAATQSVAIEMDVILPPGPVPLVLSHRIAYELAGSDKHASIIASREIAGPQVKVDQRPHLPIISPVAGPGWAAFNGCCTPNRHRDVRVGAGTHVATPEVFDIDYIQVTKDGKYFTGDGRKNSDYPFFGAPLRAVADGEVVDLRDDMADAIPLQEPTNIKTPRDYAGNYVTIRLREGLYVNYAHVKQGSVKVKVGDKVKAGQTVGELGNSGHSTAPHLHFGVADKSETVTSASLPFVIDGFEITGRITGDETDLKVVPDSRSAKQVYPLVLGIATYK